MAIAFGWVRDAARILGQTELSGGEVRRRMAGLLGAMTRRRESAGRLSGAIDHFVKVSRSYWSGLFSCYDVAELPRTNNDLEQAFGKHRYHERRATGRKGASPALVLRGVRVWWRVWERGPGRVRRRSWGRRIGNVGVRCGSRWNAVAIDAWNAASSAETPWAI